MQDGNGGSMIPSINNIYSSGILVGICSNLPILAGLLD